MLEHSQLRQCNGSLHSNITEVDLKKCQTKKQIWTWQKKFKEEGCLFRAKGFGGKSMSEEKVDKICKKIVNSPRKSIRRTSFKTQIPTTTVWRVVRKRLQMRPCKLQLLQALKADDKRPRQQVCIGMQQQIEEDQFDVKLVFSDEATFHTSGKVNEQNVQIWGIENHHYTLEQVRDSPKVTVFLRNF